MRTTLGTLFGARRSFLCHTILITIASVLAAQAWAGNLTVTGNLTTTGNLTVSSDMTAQSITLGGVTQTSWLMAGWVTDTNALPLQGDKYVIVPEGTNDTQRGNNLQAAYVAATFLNPGISNRVAVIVPPGAYNLGTTGLDMYTSDVDLIGLVPCQMTTKQVFTDSAGGQRTKTVANVQYTVTIYGAVGGDNDWDAKPEFGD